jgi:hypothetical protein
MKKNSKPARLWRKIRRKKRKSPLRIFTPLALNADAMREAEERWQKHYTEMVCRAFGLPPDALLPRRKNVR